MALGEVCEHGSLKRKCEVCSEWRPRALEAEARVAELEPIGRMSDLYELYTRTKAERDEARVRVAELEAGIRAHWDESTNGVTANMQLADSKIHALLAVSNTNA
jgi:hypothetical protein